ncbi:MAG: transposase IS116/IS110/IS902 family protein [Candidatus Magnetoglobus multicellularis str. Araruama]|uniref:Transposase IS116/IS110/IS902 family protein n=2 Tax=Candidatus Magnetoglobus multicellularis str. Araruama TaxID=890399 RepID=A0A1V1P0Q5_9BACT|nr:MAG: transposase IS116/IS110/IS902 family protein [Candidatus Magnetoglobus multicellularis str. Araruama]
MPIVHALNGEFDPIIINPAHAGNSKKKADKFDASLLAYHGLTGIWEKSFIPSGIQHDLTIVNRRFMKAKQGITKATNAIGARLIDYNILLPREIQVYSSSGKSILQAIVDGITDPVVAVKRATYYSCNLNMPDRNKKYQRLVEALTALPNLSAYARHVIGALMNEADFFERQCIIYHNWMSDLLKKIKITYDDGRVLTGLDIVDLLKTIPGVGSRYGEVLISETGIDIEKRFENAPALQSFAGFDPSKTYSADKVRSKKSKKGNKHIHTVTIQIAQAMLQHGKKDNPIAKWGRLYKMRMGGTSAAHNQAIAAIGKRIINISYHIIRTGKPYDGNRYNFNAHQTKMEKRLKQVATRVQDLAHEIHASEIDESARIIATEAIHALSSIAGIEGNFTLNSGVQDRPISELGFKRRTCNILLKAGIISFSMLWFRITQGTLLDIDRFGNKSYNDVVKGLVESGYILEKKI